MKIAICHYSCPPVIGGVETLVEQQARLLKRHHHFTKVVAGSGGKFAPDIDVDINPMLGSGIMGLYRKASGHDVRNLMEPEVLSILEYLEYSLASFEVLIAHNVLSMPLNLPFTHALLRIARKGNIRVIGWNHDSPFLPAGNARSSPGSWEVLQHPEPGVRYVCTSRTLRDEFGRLYGPSARIEVIPNGVSITNFLGLSDLTHRFIGEKRLYDTDLVLLQPARYHPDSNIGFGVEVVRALAGEGINAVLMITASIDPLDTATIEYHHQVKRSVTEAGMEGHVLFVSEFVYRETGSPVIDRALLSDFYQIADMLFVPNTKGRCGLSLMEAAVARLPIVCMDLPLFKEVCGGTGCLFSPRESPAQVALKIAELASRPHVKMFKRAMRGYNWENIYHRHILPLLGETLGQERA